MSMSERHSYHVDAFGCSFVVFGKAEPGGSKRPGQSKAGKLFVRDDNPKAAGWKREVGIVAGTLMRSRQPFEGPLSLSVTFYQARPKWHFGAHGVKKTAPRFPTVKPDATKLLRPLEDALTGIIWKDDAQICIQHVAKRYCATGEEPRVEVKVSVIL